jgi:hypothetical protein
LWSHIRDNLAADVLLAGIRALLELVDHKLGKEEMV